MNQQKKVFQAEIDKVKRESLDWELMYQDAVQESAVWEAECYKHRAEIAELEAIVKAVAHIGIDFGYGKFELDGIHIKNARELLEGKSDEHNRNQ